MDAAAPVVEFQDVSFAFDDHVILDHVNFSIEPSGLRVLLGPSGAGKSTVLKLILGLYRPDSGRIFVHGKRIDDLPEVDLLQMRADVGMLFQETALFDSLKVYENVGYRLYEETKMPLPEADGRVQDVLGFVGLADYGERMPSELSGGQRRRVAIARAMASRPGLLLFDDPTVGLDPVIATTVDDEIIKLRDLEQVTSIVVTHQIRDAHYIATHTAVKTGTGIAIVESDAARAAHARFMVLNDGRIQFEGSADELLASKDPYLERFLFMTLPPW